MLQRPRLPRRRRLGTSELGGRLPDLRGRNQQAGYERRFRKVVIVRIVHVRSAWKAVSTLWISLSKQTAVQPLSSTFNIEYCERSEGGSASHLPENTETGV